MQPQIWGSYLWKSIHFIALGYPDNPKEDDVRNYHTFYSNLWKVIPCVKCATNYKRHLEELPLDAHLISKKKLFEWTINMHNIVNKELGKPIMSKEAAYKLYTKSPPTNEWIKPVSLIIGMITVVIILLFLAMYRSQS